MAETPRPSGIPRGVIGIWLVAAGILLGWLDQASMSSGGGHVVERASERTDTQLVLTAAWAVVSLLGGIVSTYGVFRDKPGTKGYGAFGVVIFLAAVVYFLALRGFFNIWVSD